jgi:hypothetical protein
MYVFLFVNRVFFCAERDRPLSQGAHALHHSKAPRDLSPVAVSMREGQVDREEGTRKEGKRMGDCVPHARPNNAVCVCVRVCKGVAALTHSPGASLVCFSSK